MHKTLLKPHHYPRVFTVVVLLLTAAHSSLASPQSDAEKTLFSFDTKTLPATLHPQSAVADLVQRGEGFALQVRFQKTDWPQATFETEGDPWDWSGFEGVAVDIENLGDDPVKASIRVDNPSGNGDKNSNTAGAWIPARATKTLRCRFVTGAGDRLWGMRGVPILGPLAKGSKIDPSRIVAFQVFLGKPDKEHTLLLDNVRLYGESIDLVKEVPFPFVDRFGQYKHGDWPAKVFEEEELRKDAVAEAERIDQRGAIEDRDRFGGWTKGPRLEATGWFRTEKIDGKWSLVTPDGTLFFSLGVDCVASWGQTFVEGRKDWFEWLPEDGDPLSKFYGHVKGVHSMAETIGGEGKTFSFYRANLVRKYGEEWYDRWCESAYARLPAWGFNTIANWSDRGVLEKSAIPFTAAIHLGGKHRRVDGGAGYWGKMHDVYDPAFAETVDKSAQYMAGLYGKNPLCIGYFVDNEISWGSDNEKSLGRWALNSPTDQPCRKVLVGRLTEKYETIDSLNRAWGTKAEDWESLRVPWEMTETCRADLDAFILEFARTYFRSVKEGLAKHAPNQLYLGCRFSSRSEQAVEACAEFADVVSFNIYKTSVDPEEWAWFEKLDKPAVIGEFHFGALDRGMFHTGLVATDDQEDRARHYVEYVDSVLKHPSFVGCHWFQYLDEPITGRTHDGENYNIGFVSGVDRPYPEMVEAARRVHSRAYETRFGPQ